MTLKAFLEVEKAWGQEQHARGAELQGEKGAGPGSGGGPNTPDGR